MYSPALIYPSCIHELLWCFPTVVYQLTHLLFSNCCLSSIHTCCFPAITHHSHSCAVFCHIFVYSSAVFQLPPITRTHLLFSNCRLSLTLTCCFPAAAQVLWARSWGVCWGCGLHSGKRPWEGSRNCEFLSSWKYACTGVVTIVLLSPWYRLYNWLFNVNCITVSTG